MNGFHGVGDAATYELVPGHEGRVFGKALPRQELFLYGIFLRPLLVEGVYRATGNA